MQIVILIVALLLLQWYFRANLIHRWFGTFIEVTDEDINEGLVGSQSNCPIARAITRSLKDKYKNDEDIISIGWKTMKKTERYHGSVSKDTVGAFYGWVTTRSKNGILNDKGGEHNQIWREYSLDLHPAGKLIKKFVRRFDRHEKVYPFSFKLYI